MQNVLAISFCFMSSFANKHETAAGAGKTILMYVFTIVKVNIDSEICLGQQ
jgi:hypothetical protein